MRKRIFYDITPFNYGLDSKEELINNMHPFLKKEIERVKGKLIYDIGCGCGRNLVYAVQYGVRIIGVDISKESLSYTKRYLDRNNLELIHANNLDLPIDDHIADLVISDGVIHHTGDTLKAFNECMRIIKKGGSMYLAVYKKWRYYPLVYIIIGGVLRFINNIRIGKIIIDKILVKLHYILYVIFKRQRLNLGETRNIFYDYFLTPVATFQSKKQVKAWIKDQNSTLVQYDRTNGNCHVFVIQKV